MALHARKGQSWTDAEVAALRRLHAVQAPLSEMVLALARSGEAIDRQLAKIGLTRTGRTRHVPTWVDRAATPGRI